MGAILLALLIAGPIVSAIAGAVCCHFAERIHWHRLAQTWYDDGRDAGWYAARQYYGTMVPDVVFTSAGTLEAIPPDDREFITPAEDWDRLALAAAAGTAVVVAGPYLP
jgi:hypothetical protein